MYLCICVRHRGVYLFVRWAESNQRWTYVGAHCLSRLIAVCLFAYSDSYSTSHLFSNSVTVRVRERHSVWPIPCEWKSFVYSVHTQTYATTIHVCVHSRTSVCVCVRVWCVCASICTDTLSQWYISMLERVRVCEKKSQHARTELLSGTHTLESALTINDIIIVWAANQTRLPQYDAVRVGAKHNNNNNNTPATVMLDVWRSIQVKYQCKREMNGIDFIVRGRKKRTSQSFWCRSKNDFAVRNKMEVNQMKFTLQFLSFFGVEAFILSSKKKCVNRKKRKICTATCCFWTANDSRNHFSAEVRITRTVYTVQCEFSCALH